MEKEPVAFVEFKPGRYYSALWCLRLPVVDPQFTGGDLLAVLWREDDEPTTWHFDWRFRWHRDAKVWNSEDKKSAYHSTVTSKSEEEVLDHLARLFAAMPKATDAKPFWIKGDSKRVMDLFRNSPPHWMHTQQMTQE